MNRRLRAAWSPPPVRHPVRDGARLVPRAARPPATGERLPGALVVDLVAAVLAGGASPPVALRVVGETLARAGDPAGHRLERVAAELTHQAPSGTSPEVSARASSRRLPWRPVPDSSVEADWVEVLSEEMALAMSSGLPPAALLRRAAEEQRRRSAAAHRRAVGRLEVLLVVPTGLCLLPAFVLLGIVPVVIGLLRG